MNLTLTTQEKKALNKAYSQSFSTAKYNSFSKAFKIIQRELEHNFNAKTVNPDNFLTVVYNFNNSQEFKNKNLSLFSFNQLDNIFKAVTGTDWTKYFEII